MAYNQRSAQITLAVLIFATYISVPLAFSQGAGIGGTPPTPKEKLEKALGGESISGMSKPSKFNALNAGGKLTDILMDPASLELINRITKEAVLKDSGILFLKDVDFKLKTFGQPNDGKELALGFAYSYEKNLRKEPVSLGDYGVLDLSLATQGTVAFERERNIEDFIDTKLNFSFFGSWGGDFENFSDADYQAYLALKSKLIGIKDKAELQRLKKEGALRAIRSKLTNQYGLEVGGKLAFETDQSFSKQQIVYGGQLGFVVNGWEKFDGRTWDTISTLGKLNILDYPFAAIRWATNFDEGFAPRSLNFPAAMLSIAMVDPVANDPRAAFGDGSAFPRFHSEISFKTQILKVPDERFEKLVGIIYFSVNHRYYYEIGAATGVSAANLDEYSYVVFTLAGTKGVFLSYSDGKLPFDRTSDSFYQLGYKFHF